VENIEHIGKEGDNWEEDELLGSTADSMPSCGFSPDDRARAVAVVGAAPRRQLKARAKVSHETIRRAAKGDPAITDQMLRHLFDAALVLDEQVQAQASRQAAVLAWLIAEAEIAGSKAVAGRLGYDHSNLIKVITGERLPSKELVNQVRRIVEGIFLD